MGLETIFGTYQVFVFECSCLSRLNKGYDHNSGHVMKFIYMRSTCSLAVLNKGLNLDEHQLKQFVYTFTYNLSVLNMRSKRFVLQVMKFV